VADACDPCPEDVGDDSDGDGVCDGVDACPGFDDGADGDGDGVADGCDPCPVDDPDDVDGDGVCDADDACPGFDDLVDQDGDGQPDACDTCPMDLLDDSDGDGSCDSDDLCPGADDGVDADREGVPDGCDSCPLDDPDDTDGDGVCESNDLCPGADDGLDADADGVPDACDQCAGGDDTVDGDGDGAADACDACPVDPLDDVDGDGACDSADLCPGRDDAADTDGDGVPDGCECSDALGFDRDALDGVEIPYAADFLLGAGDFTIEFQARFASACAHDASSGACTVVSHSDGAGIAEKWSLAWAPDDWSGGGVWLHIADAAGASEAFFFYNDPGLLNGWHHYAVVRAGTDLLLYVDGLQVAAEILTGAMPAPAAPLELGRSEGGNALEGALRQLRLSDVARYGGDYLPRAELIADAATVALWPMDEASGLVLGDLGAGAHDGTLLGPEWVWACAEADAPRTVLTHDDLVLGPEQPGPVADGAGFGMPPGASLPDHLFEGRLELLAPDLGGHFLEVRDDYNYRLDAERLHLPDFDHAFVQDGHDLIPVVRGNIQTAHPYWTTILGPGKVWKEVSDQGLSRATIPFALVQRNANCTHNGLIAFLFDDVSVSRVHYQITQETCAYFKGDFWGLLDATYHPETLPTAAQVRADYAAEVTARVPTRPVEELAVDFPGFDLSTLSSGISPLHTTRYGFVYGGISYVSDCVTRSGSYPYCEVMRMPSYSVAKSLYAGTVRMVIEQEYGVDVGTQIVDTWVPEAAAGRGDFTDVTVDHALDMTTGHYKFATYMVDEAGAAMTADFFLAETLADKSAGAFDWQRKNDPGNIWVYRTSDTFIATRAMSAYLSSLAGADTDLFDYLVDRVWRPLGVGPGAFTSLRTSDNNWQGETFGGYGLWLIGDDLAKLSRLLNVDGGQIGVDQVLEPSALDAALQRDPLDRGIVTTAPPFQYNDGFWALEFTQLQGYPCDFWVPFMSGFGGISVVMMPNGATFWVVSDNDEYDWQDVVDQAQATVADNCLP